MLGAIPYTGNKQNLLNDIIPHFPEYSRFIDCFCGGLSVSMNVKGPVVSNDIQTELIQMYEWMKDASYDDLLSLKDELNLTATNKQAYLDARELYNKTKRSDILFLLIQHSFSNMLRYSAGKFNVSFGYRTFTRNTFKRWNNFQSKDIQFENKHYEDLEIKNGDFIYCDPPYLITDAAYNAHWSEAEEQKLLSWLDSLHKRGIKFCVSNVLEHQGKTNEILTRWSSNYQIVELSKKYVFNHHHTSNKDMTTREVLIKNY
ncbi:MAG: hypothetical protein [Caudoviricetes sp.]|nr:MAG: hypothetical protein [Caudoviricetes sp.]